MREPGDYQAAQPWTSPPSLMPKMTSGPATNALRYKYTRTAHSDIEGILRYTAGRLGTLQRRRYAELIDRAASMVAAAPMQRGSRLRDEVASGVRSFHIEIAARRHGAGAHVLYYIPGELDDGRDGIIILRVLHDRMDPARHITPD